MPTRIRQLIAVLAAIATAALALVASAIKASRNELGGCAGGRPSGTTFSPASALWSGSNKWRFHFFLDIKGKPGQTGSADFSGFAGNWHEDFAVTSDGYAHVSTFGPAAVWNSGVRDHNEAVSLTIGGCPYQSITSDTWRLELTPIYVAALGDSYSSGEGNPPFSANQVCHRSFSAWPYLLSNQHYRFDVYQKNLACSGATVDDLTTVYRGQLAQADELKQLAQSKPLNIVMVTIGGNDVGFRPVIEDCFLPKHNCVKDGRVLQAMKDIKQLAPTLTRLYSSLKKDVQPWTKVMVVGYPSIFPAVSAGTHKCSWLSPDEQNALLGATKQLGQMAAKSAKEAGVEFVDTLNAFKGHELCTPDSWVRPIGRRPPYDGHPNKDGQDALAKAVRTYILNHLDYRFYP